VARGKDVVEYLLAGAHAVCIGTAHFEDPRAARRILDELILYGKKHSLASVRELIGAMRPW
jgi:dihydroorotate dehydrogenase